MSHEDSIWNELELSKERISDLEFLAYYNAKKRLELETENKRYREALEEIIYMDYSEETGEYTARRVARDALKEDV